MTEGTPKESTSLGSLLAGLVVGAAIGAAVAVLYAPKPGKETREELGKRLDDLKDQVDRTAHDVAEFAKTRLAEAQQDLAQAIDASRTAAAEHAAELRRQVGID